MQYQSAETSAGFIGVYTMDVFGDVDVGFKLDIYSRDPTVLKVLNAKL